jgi:GT2 family glycosyltransferase/glycosyltransferase involved in cell wall biosynthesis
VSKALNQQKKLAPTPKTSPAQLVVLGMHRSGTSAVTGALSAMGAYVGDEESLTGKNWENPVGFFERKDLRAICDSILHASGADWWKVANFDPQRVSHTVTRARLPELQAVVARMDEAAEQHRSWVVKEPRLCLLYPILQRALVRPQIILALRHPLEVAKSLRSRNGFSMEGGLALWEAYMVHAIRSCANAEPVLVNYDDLISQPKLSLEKLAKELAARGVEGLDSDRGASTIMGNLRREIDDHEHDYLMTEAQVELWEVLNSGKLPAAKVSLSARGHETLTAFEVDEATRKSLEAEIRSLRQQLSDTKAIAVRSDALAKDVDAQTAANAKLRVELTSEIEKSKSLIENVEALKEQLRLAQDQVLAEEKLRQAEAEKVESLEQKLSDYSEKLEDANARVRKATEDANARVQKATEEANARVQKARSDTAEYANTLSDLKKQRDQLQKAVVEANAGTDKLQKELRAQATRLNAAWNYRKTVTSSLRWKVGGLLLLPLIPVRFVRAKLAHRTNKINRMLIEASDLFDRNRYIEQYPDVADDGLDPLEHYLTVGWRDGREPGSNFSSRGYLSKYPDVAALNTNPLLHYLKHGKAEGRNPRPKLTQMGTPVGEEYEQVQASGLFDQEFYLNTYADVKAANIDALEHYLTNGWKENRDPSSAFSTEGYFQLNPDVASANMNPLVHYVTNGKAESRAIVARSAFKRAAAGGGTVSNSPPDLFDFRAAERTANTMVMFNVTDRSALNALLEWTRENKVEADILITYPNEITPLQNPISVARTSSVFALPYPTSWSASRTFMHLVNNGPLVDYHRVLWAHKFGEASLAQSEYSNNLRALLASSASPTSLTSDQFDLLVLDDHLEIRRAIGTIFARLGRQRPQGTLEVPSGDIIGIPSLIINQLKSCRVGDRDLGNDHQSNKLIASIIGAIAEEGDIDRVASVETSSAGVTSGDGRTVKAIAFYLPQFHPIPENDRWWGKGFTEWTNVTKARPLFRSHYQPQLPADLGFYDLRSPETQLAQANLAHDYGLHGFCYYYYWFDGKKVLNEPIEQMLESGSPNFPFCVCWANENWSRNWDGQNRHVLLEQHYSEESNRALIHEFIKLMRDERYIRHNGKPVLLVYRIRIIPNWLETARMWREECRKAGIGEIHLCAVRFGLEPLDGQPSEFGLDSFVLFPPHESEKVDARGSVHDLARDFNGTIFDYDAAMWNDLERFDDGYEWPVHRGVMLGWDNTARRPRDSRIFLGSTPARLHRWLKGIVRQENQHNKAQESLVFVNAWNEWAEGTMLEPSTRFGRGYLEALRSAIGSMVRTSERPSPRAVVEVEVVHQAEARVRTKWLGGERPHTEDAPTILVCAHVVSHQLFGAERSFLDILDALGTLGVNVVVALPTDVHTYYVKLCQERSCSVSIVPYTQWRDDREPDDHVTAAFETLISEQEVDIVYANTIVLLEPLIAARKLGRKTIIHARELVDRDEGLVAQIGLDPADIVRRVEGLADAIVANSEATRQLFKDHDSTFRIPNIVHPDDLDIANTPGDKIRFVMASSNIPKKGLTDFVAVARKCETTCPNAEFVLVGPENAHTKALKEDSLPANVIFAGYADSPAQAMAQGNIVMSLSHFAESFGRTVAEAQAARRPVIAYDWGAVPELVSVGETGFLAPYRDIDTVCEHVRTFCNEPELIARFGETGRLQMLANYSPAVLSDGLRDVVACTTAKTATEAGQDRPITIVVPVYNAFEAVGACLESLRNTTANLPNIRILMLNDGSSDARIAPLLSKFSRLQNFHLHTNKENKGYTRTINIGINWAGRDDVILLNSDAVVTDGWLQGLRKAAYSDALVSTATAMSDNAGAFSFPIQNEANPKPADVSFEEFAHSITSQTGKLKPVPVPTGSGFCMYIRRDAFDRLGLFDEEAFPRGYGEENDFCMRVVRSGFQNVISPYSYVFHVRSASFGKEKELLIKGAVDTVTQRYPDYAARVKEAFGSPEMQALRQASQEGVVHLRESKAGISVG